MAPNSLGIRTLHRELALPFPGLVSNSADGIPIRHPGLLNAERQIWMCMEAVASSDTHFSDDILLPSLPSFDQDAPDSGKKTYILNGIFNPDVEIPPKLSIFEEPIPAEIYEQVCAKLVEWLKDTLPCLQQRDALEHGRFPDRYLLRMVRAFFWISSAQPDRLGALLDLYHDAVNVFSALACYRYTRLILEPLVTEIDGERGRFLTPIRSMTSKMASVVRSWNRYFAREAPLLLQVRPHLRFLLTHS